MPATSRPRSPPPRSSRRSPPGWWARLWERLRTSPVTRPALIIVPVAAVLVVGVVGGRGDSGSPPFVAEPAPTPAPEPEASADVIAQWQTNAEPVLAEVERDVERVLEAVVDEEPALAVLQCRESSERVAAWSPGLVPAPDAELDRELRSALDQLSRAFDGCSTPSVEGLRTAVAQLEIAGAHLGRARERVTELTS
ncbi:MAG: hypothetical protein H0V95_14345 [Actinobacteria bacterium]|nr:hypothetical protein [Actinomycetota bacterium]